MPYIETITAQKARQINNTSSIYGTFAEIGAGQGVVNHFFKAGQASQTVAKSMSAYDMIFSDEIYGQVGRYVSEDRLLKMLDHEYSLLQRRLKKKRGDNTRFFAFANTVTASTVSRGVEHISRHHGWMGIRFQSVASGSYNEIILHVNLLDKTRLQQYETLGILGVNLIYSAFYVEKKTRSIIKSLFDNFEPNRIDINLLRSEGKIFKQLNQQELNLELIRQNLTQALLFQNNGTNVLPADTLYEKPVLIVQDTPDKTDPWEPIQKALSHIKKHKNISSPMLLIDVPLSHLKGKTIHDFLKKYTHKIKAVKNWHVLVSHFNQLYELKDFIQNINKKNVFMLLPSSTLARLVNKKSQKQSEEDVLNFFGRLCGRNIILITHGNKAVPFYNRQTNLKHLEQHLLSAGQLVHLD